MISTPNRTVVFFKRQFNDTLPQLKLIALTVFRYRVYPNLRILFFYEIETSTLGGRLRFEKEVKTGFIQLST